MRYTPFVLVFTLVAVAATTLQTKEDLYSIPARSKYSRQSFAGAKPLTRPERTNFTETSHYEDVVGFIDSLKLLGAKIETGSIGKTALGRELPYVIASRPLITTPEEARRLGRPVAYIQANIHSGEVEGKEAMLSMLRDLIFDKKKNVLDSIVLIVQPDYNADGNDHFDVQSRNRGSQNGPEMVGTRQTSCGWNLNRDYISLDAPESKGSLAMLNKWNPDLFMDLHTTDGSIHGYALTYSPPLAPTAVTVIPYVTKTMLPVIRRRMRERQGFETQDYGDFSRIRPATAGGAPGGALGGGGFGGGGRGGGAGAANAPVMRGCDTATFNRTANPSAAAGGANARGGGGGAAGGAGRAGDSTGRGGARGGNARGGGGGGGAGGATQAGECAGGGSLETMIADSIPTKCWAFSTYEAVARYGTNYYGLRGRMSILSEAFSHDPFDRRIASTYDFVAEILSYVAEHRAEVINVGKQADAKVAGWAKDPSTSPKLSLRSRMDTTRIENVRVEVVAPLTDSTKREPGIRNQQRTGVIKLVKLPVMASFAPTLTSTLPFAYAFDAKTADALRPVLARHGLKVEKLDAAATVTAQSFTFDTLFIGGQSESARRMTVSAGTWAKPASQSLPAGTFIVRAAQPLGLLAFYLLEPESEDGLLQWSFFDGLVAPHTAHPVLRITKPATLRTSPSGD